MGMESSSARDGGPATGLNSLGKSIVEAVASVEARMDRDAEEIERLREQVETDAIRFNAIADWLLSPHARTATDRMVFAGDYVRNCATEATAAIAGEGQA